MRSALEKKFATMQTRKDEHSSMPLQQHLLSSDEDLTTNGCTTGDEIDKEDKKEKVVKKKSSKHVLRRHRRQTDSIVDKEATKENSDKESKNKSSKLASKSQEIIDDNETLNTHSPSQSSPPPPPNSSQRRTRFFFRNLFSFSSNNEIVSTSDNCENSSSSSTNTAEVSSPIHEAILSASLQKLANSLNQSLGGTLQSSEFINSCGASTTNSSSDESEDEREHKQSLIEKKARKTDKKAALVEQSAQQKLESIFGVDTAKLLIVDHTSKMKSISHEQNNASSINNSTNSLSLIESSSLTTKISLSSAAVAELDAKKRQKLDEYANIEDKQAKLLKILNERVYKRIRDEANIDDDELHRVFYVVAELEQLASMVHEQVALELRRRVQDEWCAKPYCGDILAAYYHYYKVYKAILERYPNCQCTLSNLLKRKAFAAQLKKLLEAEADNLENVNRLDMLLDRLVDFPRRLIQLLESYLKLLDIKSKEYEDIKKILLLFNDIFESSNDALNKTSNFQQCYELQYMFDPPLLNIVDQNRQLIKQGPLLKVAKRSGELLLRHLALFTDMLLVCKYDRIRKKLILKYHIPSKDIKLIENSNESNEVMFRIVSLDQNNEFKAENPKDKEEWMKAFKKAKDVRINDKTNEIYPDQITNMKQIGIVPPIWVKDSEQSVCSTCKEAFNAFKRRHHCRTCGRIYCSSCCGFFVPVKFNEFKEKVRVCKNCYNALEKVYQDHLTEIHQQQQTQQKSDSNGMNDDMELSKSASSKFLGEHTQPIVLLSGLMKNFAYSLGLNSTMSSKEMNESKSSGLQSATESDKSKEEEEDDDDDDDSFSDDSFSEQPVSRPNGASSLLPPQNPLKFPSELQQPPLLSSKDRSMPTQPKLNRLIQVRKKETLLAEYGYLGKISINESADQVKRDSIKWERSYFVLYSDLTIGVFASHTDLNHAMLVIQYDTLQLKPNNETTFGLYRNDIVNSSLTPSKSSDANNNLDDSTKEQTKPAGNLKDKLKMFEYNYELKFNNKESKKKWFEMLSKDMTKE